MPEIQNSLMNQFVAASSYHNVFNSDLITTLRKNDNMVQTLEELCKIIGDTMAPNIEYLGYEIVDQRVKYPSAFVQLYDSNIYCVEFNFKITGYEKNGEISTIYKKMIFEIPTLIDGEYYFIEGNRFYPIYQLLDATTYHKENSVTLKTLTLPIKLTRTPTMIVDVDDNKYTSYLFHTDIQRKKVNFLTFFFSTLGFFKTLRFFEGPTEIFFICDASKVVHNDPENSYFQISKDLFLKVKTQYLTKSLDIRSIIACILETCNKKITLDELRHVDYWKYDVLCYSFVKQKTCTKNAKINLFLESYIRLYDSITKENMKNFEEPKQNIYEVLRWMFINFTKLLYRDNASIYNKRVRLSEYQIAPIVRKTMTKMHRVMHSRDRFKTPKKYEEILTLPYRFSADSKDKGRIDQCSDILIKSIVNSNNTKYSDCVNDMNLLNIVLKWTLNAPSTTISKTAKSNSLSLSQRAQSPSFIGIISLNTSGAGDPGGTGCFTPFVKLYNGFFKQPSSDKIEE